MILFYNFCISDSLNIKLYSINRIHILCYTFRTHIFVCFHFLFTAFSYSARSLLLLTLFTMNICGLLSTFVLLSSLLYHSSVPCTSHESCTVLHLIPCQEFSPVSPIASSLFSLLNFSPTLRCHAVFYFFSFSLATSKKTLVLPTLPSVLSISDLFISLLILLHYLALSALTTLTSCVLLKPG